MLRFAFLLLPTLLTAAILPENVGPYHKTGTQPLKLDDRAVWDEYGLQDSEQATYENSGKILTVRAYRLQDATAAMAAYQWQRPAHATPGKVDDLTKLAVETPTGEIVALGNHLLAFEGYRPTSEDLALVFRSLPRHESGSLPSLPGYLPSQALLPNSERYITGPASLARFGPEITPSAAAFHLGTEAQSGVYGDMKLAIFNFPTPEFARERNTEFAKLPGLIVKRTGPLLAVVIRAKDANAAEKLLAQVRYQATITTGQKPLGKKDNWGDFLLNLLILIGIVALFCVLSGLVFGGLRQLFRRAGPSGDGENMISLHLGDR